MKAGVGKSAFKFPLDFFPVEGFSKVYDPLHVRVVILSDNEDILIVSLEMTSLAKDEIDEIKTIISKETHIKRKNIWVCVTHTFSAPHILPDFVLQDEISRNKKVILKQLIFDAVREATQTAKAGMTEISLGFGSGTCYVNINRDFETPNGWWIGNRGDGPSNKELSIIRINNSDGNLMAVIFHYAVQSSILDGSILSDYGKAVSSDLAGVACSQIEHEYNNVVAIFMLGASGDQSPIKKAKTVSLNSQGIVEETDIKEDGIALCQELGAKLANDTKIVIDRTDCPITSVHIEIHTLSFEVPTKHMTTLNEIKPTHLYEYNMTGKKKMNIEVLCIGNIAFLGVKPELNCITARKIVENSSFAKTLVTTMVNGGAKYMADSNSYDRFTYEAMNSPFAKGSAEILCEHAINLLDSLCIKK